MADTVDPFFFATTASLLDSLSLSLVLAIRECDILSSLGLLMVLVYQKPQA
jgi:hypothetical protein